MQNDQGVGVANNPINQQPTGGAPPMPTVGDTAGVPQTMPPPTAAKASFRLHSGRRWLWIALGIVAGLFVVAGIIVVLTSKTNNGQQQVLSGSFNSVQIPLDGLSLSGLSDLNANSLKVNGQLQLSGSMALTPTLQPQNPARGQLYFDQGSNQLMYYNGQQFIAAGGSTNTTNNTVNNTNSTTNVTNIFNSGGGSTDVQLQGSAPGVQQSGNFNISGTGQVGTLRTGTVSNSGNLSVATDAGAGATGNITIKSGNSSTTASGNISIDAGSGVIDGEVVEDKTFEGGLDNMQPWFSTSIATTNAQAHSGIQSLEATITQPFGWGVIEQLPGAPVTPGHQYFFSLWIRADTTPRTIGGRVVWQGTGGTTVTLPSVVDSTTGWTQITLLAQAPAGATSVSFEFQSGVGVPGEIHYFDDITVTDLSSGSALSSIDIGSTDAKIITIGNMNQVGTTTIRGGSGIDIQSGAASTVINGGTVNITGNAASTFNTTAGALTLTSGSATTWSVGTASTGVGGDLTLHAGAGAAGGNNDGGDLILQGGASTGTGLGGSVIARPLADSTNAFEIQSSANTKLFVADTTNMRLYVGDPAGGASAVVLVLSNQTTASDPTGVNGAMYYNSSLGKFRCYQQQWRDCIGDDIINTYRYSNEFGNTITGTTGADNTLLSNFSGAGAGAPNGGGEIQHPGISGLNTGTTTTGSAAYMSGIPAGSTTLRLGNNVAWMFRSAVRINNLSTGTETHTARVGFIDSNSGESTDGCFFRYTDSINGGRWQGVCRDNNTESVCDTGVAVGAGAWKTMEIGVAADASAASFVISGVQRCTIATNIPTASGRNTGFGFSIIKSAGTTAAQMDIDFVDIRATGSGFGSRE